MHIEFSVSQKLGLMFRPDDVLPQNIKSWALDQIYTPSPALGISSANSKVNKWPVSLNPELDERAFKFTQFRQLEKNATSKDRKANRVNNLMRPKDELRFSHRNIYGKDQIKLRLMSFWANHFTIGNTNDNEQIIGHAMEKAILANLNDSFSNMLFKVTTHPAMLIYLDNNNSAGPNSKRVSDLKKKGKQAGLNDNLGRELLELHTVSPSAKYTEADIKDTAKVLAGWGFRLNIPINQMQNRAGTTNHWDVYKQDWAEPGNKVILGKKISSGKPGLKQLTNFLAAHEHTVIHLSTKLSEHFISEVPNQSDIDYIANAWRESNGSLDHIHTAVIKRAIISKDSKFQWPINWLFQVIRLSDSSYFKGWDEIELDSKILMDSSEIFEELGQSFWSNRQPDGYSSKKEDWTSGEMFERRIRFSESIWRSGKPSQNPNMIMDRIGATDETRKLVDSVGNSMTNQFVALMCSPELMGLKNA
tara:strand:+ start:933 stop:2357 length:1425 start_codon:yes stop_codon:yes gene_type:complete